MPQIYSELDQSTSIAIEHYHERKLHCMTTVDLQILLHNHIVVVINSQDELLSATSVRNFSIAKQGLQLGNKTSFMWPDQFLRHRAYCCGLHLKGGLAHFLYQSCSEAS